MKKLILFGVAPFLALLVLWGCSEKVGEPVLEPEEQKDVKLSQNTCLGCHSSEDKLKAALGGGSYSIPAVSTGDG